LDTLFAFLEDERLTRNMERSSHYFEFWKFCLEHVPPIIDYCLRNEMLTVIGELFMHYFTPSQDKNKTRG
jgi:hypothetical protein